MSFFIREISKDDKVGSLSLGDANFKPLKSFLKNQSKELHSNNITKTYVLVDSKEPLKVVGFISLVCSEITIDDTQKPKNVICIGRYDIFPAVKIARLAVSSKLQKNGLGGALIEHAIGIVKKYIMPYIGCRYLLVDSKPNAIKFYEKRGFSLLDDDENKNTENPLMFLDMHPLAIKQNSEIEGLSLTPENKNILQNSTEH